MIIWWRYFKVYTINIFKKECEKIHLVEKNKDTNKESHFWLSLFVEIFHDYQFTTNAT